MITSTHNHLTSSMENQIKALHNMSEDKIFVVMKAVTYAQEMDKKSEISSTKRKLNWSEDYNMIAALFLTVSCAFLVIEFLIIATLYFSNAGMNVANVKTMLISTVLFSAFSFSVYFLTKKIFENYSQKMIELTDAHFHGKFESISRAEFYFVHNIQLNREQWQDPKFWQQMKREKFINWVYDMVNE